MTPKNTRYKVGRISFGIERRLMSPIFRGSTELSSRLERNITPILAVPFTIMSYNGPLIPGVRIRTT
jgi:hypothetical protein